MPQSYRNECSFGRAARLRAIVLRAALTIALASAVAGLHGGTARAGDDDPDDVAAAWMADVDEAARGRSEAFGGTGEDDR